MSRKIIEVGGGMNRVRLLIPMMLCAMILCSRAAEETSRHRIIGLFSPDRQDDLRQAMSAIPDVHLAGLDYDSAEATFRYDVSALITGFNPKKPPTADAVAKRLADLLKAASHGTFTLKPLATTPQAKMEIVEIKVGILDCKGCRYGAYLAVAKLDGVERATVNAETRTLTAWIDPSKTDRASLEEALKKARVDLPAP